MQNDNAQIKIDSSLLHISTKEGFKEIYYEFPTNFYEFWNFIQISVNYSNEFRKEKRLNRLWADLGPQASVPRAGSLLSATGQPRE
jgi:hypothetical protein